MGSDTTAITKSILGTSPRLKARIAGVLYVLAVLTAVFGEVFVRGRLAVASGLIAGHKPSDSPALQKAKFFPQSQQNL